MRLSALKSEASGDHHQSESDRTRVRAARFGRNSFGKSGFVPGTRVEVITKGILVVIRS